MKVVIPIRTVADYRSMTKEKFEAQLNQKHKPMMELRVFIANNMLNVWDQSFRMSYVAYRDRISKLARQTLEATGCDILPGPEEFIEWYTSDQDEDAIICPIDDDDWFAPNISDVASYFDKDTQLVVWNNTVLHSITRYHFGVGDGHRLASNNWAVRKSYLKSLPKNTGRNLILDSHYHAETYMKKELPKNKIKYIDERFNVYNRHPASLSFIREKINELEIQYELPKIGKREVTCCEPPEGMEWCRDYLTNLYVLGLQLRKMVIKI